jgi:hypothetical protein
VQEWGQTLWGIVTRQTQTAPPVVSPPVHQPDDSWRQDYKWADGTIAVMTIFHDGSGRLEITFPDGRTQTSSQSKPVFDHKSKTTIDWQVTTSEGLNVAYTSVRDDKATPTNMADDTVEVNGASLLPDGQDQQFGVVTGNGETHLDSQQSDGSQLTLEVPLAQPRYSVPDFAQTAQGSYVSPQFNIRLDLASPTVPPTRWTSLAADLGGGLTGGFALQPDFSGQGRLLDGGQLIALLSWTARGKTEISFTSAGRGATSPAGAAIDYLIHRWQTLQALQASAASKVSLLGS